MDSSFTSDDGPTKLDIKLDETSHVHFDPSFLTKEEADILFNHLFNDIPWRESSMVASDGNTYTLPRLQHWMADSPDVKAQLYQKGGPLNWSDAVLSVKNKLEKLLNVKFDYVLLNYYRNGKDKIGFHRDDEADEEGKNVIASVSIGCSRTFLIKPFKGSKQFINENTNTFILNHGSLIVMDGDTQKGWVHSIRENKKLKEPRINLTFRKS